MVEKLGAMTLDLRDGKGMVEAEGSARVRVAFASIDHGRLAITVSERESSLLSTQMFDACLGRASQ